LNQNAFLLLFLLPADRCRQRLGFRTGKIICVPGSSTRTLGGVHILLIDSKKAILTFLPGYGEWEGERGFWTSSGEPPLELRYKLVKENKRKVYMFELTSREGVFLTIRPGVPLPFRKTIPFLDYRNGVVSSRSDLGSFFSMVSVHVRWPASLSGILTSSTRVLACGYVSSTVTVFQVVPRKAFEYLSGTVLNGDMREIRSRPVHHVWEIKQSDRSKGFPIHQRGLNVSRRF